MVIITFYRTVVTMYTTYFNAHFSEALAESIFMIGPVSPDGGITRGGTELSSSEMRDLRCSRR